MDTSRSPLPLQASSTARAPAPQANGHQIPPGHGAADLAAAAPVEARPVPEQRRAVTVPFSVYRVDGV